VLVEIMTMPDTGLWGYLSSLFPTLSALTVSIAAILAWVAKLRWAKEYGAAKDAQIASLQSQITTLTNAHTEVIKAKDAHIVLLDREIKGLQDFSSTKLREYFKSTKEGLEEYINELQETIERYAQERDESYRRFKEHMTNYPIDESELEREQKEFEELKRINEKELIEMHRKAVEFEERLRLEELRLKELESAKGDVLKYHVILQKYYGPPQEEEGHSPKDGSFSSAS
jgi:hypothetical protein